MDSVKDETLAVSITNEHLETGSIKDKMHDRPLLLQKRGHRRTTEDLQKVQAPEEHGLSYEWESCPKLQLTEDGKKILCKTQAFVLIVVPGLSSSSSASSSSTSLAQDSSGISSSPAIPRKDT